MLGKLLALILHVSGDSREGLYNCCGLRSEDAVGASQQESTRGRVCGEMDGGDVGGETTSCNEVEFG